eukprot:1594819-Amphidinium_carterae.1
MARTSDHLAFQWPVISSRNFPETVQRCTSTNANLNAQTIQTIASISLSPSSPRSCADHQHLTRAYRPPPQSTVPIVKEEAQMLVTSITMHDDHQPHT